MFSFPPLIESDQQTGNWYQALLDHPQCQGDPAKIQEAYESYRQASLKSSIASVSSWDSQSATAKIAPSPVLVQYLSQVAAKAVNTDPVVQPEHPETTYQTENVNCMVIWARPSAKVVNLALDLQSKVRAAVGTGE
ncbi:hypothetical protein PRK78_004635 [Emydomyces testavorans]|uniref:Uncharacterized protein n=1 Tax=Emydomyces testavorans TaxID=2070801 RepID=A0AAF0DKL0_9EURO|nr:hypothetical protein PRK78_004635 [Emydomyces testavorans]